VIFHEKVYICDIKLWNMKQRILFVCLGNICRSPAAEAMLRMLVEREGIADRVVIDSAGTYGGHAGERSDARMRRAAAARGIEMPHLARQVREADFDKFDMLIAMDDNNYEALFRLAPDRAAQQKIFRFREFLRHNPDWSYIPDPYYEGHEGFELVLDLLEDGCSTLLEQLR
jgi:protein-tyrosine phosphatase